MYTLYMTEIWNFIMSLFETMWEFRFLIIIIVVGGIALLYAIYLGRRGQIAKTGMPTYSPEFALGAFGFEMNKMLRTVLALVTVLLMVAIIGVWYWQSRF